MPSTPVCVHAEVSRLPGTQAAHLLWKVIAFSVTTMASHRGSRSCSTFSQLTKFGKHKLFRPLFLFGQMPLARSCQKPARLSRFHGPSAVPGVPY